MFLLLQKLQQSEGEKLYIYKDR